MATLERTYNVPLRKEFLRVPRYKRAKKAVTAVKEFLSRHMKSDKVIIGKYLNQKIWERGIKSPPHHVNVTASKDEKGTVTAELVGAPKPIVKETKEKTQKQEVKKDTEELQKELSGELKESEVLKKAEKTQEKPKKEAKPKTKKAKTEEKSE